MGELLGAIGLAWPRLLLYPGGVSALLLAWLIGRWLRGSGGQRPPAAAGSPPIDHHLPSILELSAVVAPLLLIATLPLPYAAEFRYPPDFVLALGLLEWPRLLAIATPREGGGRASWRLTDGYGWWSAQALSYGLLVLAALALSEADAALTLGALPGAGGPGATPSPIVGLAGAAGWLIAVAGTVDRDVAQNPGGRWPGWGLRLRLLGHLLIVALPLLAFVEGAPWLALAAPAALLVALLWLRAAVGPRGWRMVQAGSALALLALLGWSAFTSLAERLAER